MIVKTILAVACVLLVSRLVKFARGLKSVSYLPGLRPLFSPLSLFGAILPTTWWNPGAEWTWKQRRISYFNHEHEVISMVPVLFGSPCYYIGSVDVMKQLLANELKIPLVKTPAMMAPLLLWGPNVVASSGEPWKQYRKIVSPSFKHETYVAVVDEVKTAYADWLQDWEGCDTVIVKNVREMMLRLALIVIARIGFGLPMTWKDVVNRDPQSLAYYLTTVSETNIVRLATPGMLYKLPIKMLHEVQRVWTNLALFINRCLENKKDELSRATSDKVPNDLFSLLVAATLHGDHQTKAPLRDEEVIGNTFSFMFAGHETTALGISATLGYLALHQDVQQTAYEEVARVLGDHPLSINDVQAMKFVSGCFYESVRLFPGGPLLPRDVIEDTVVKISRPTKANILLKKGSQLIIDLAGCHYDPFSFPDAESYRPERWLNSSENDLTMFGFGPRTCLGRKFATTEAVSFLAHFLRDWKVDIVLQPGETRKDWEARCMDKPMTLSLALGVKPFPLKLSCRNK